MTGHGVGPLADDPATVARAFGAGIGGAHQVARQQGAAGAAGAAGTAARMRSHRARARDGSFRISGPIYTARPGAWAARAVLAHEAFTAVVSSGRWSPLISRCSRASASTRAASTSCCEVAHVLPADLPCDIGRPGRVRQPRRVQLDYGLFRFIQAARPIYPLDPPAAFEAA